MTPNAIEILLVVSEKKHADIASLLWNAPYSCTLKPSSLPERIDLGFCNAL